MENKYQYGALLLAVIIGAVAGSWLMSNRKDREINKLREEQKKELQIQIDAALDFIEASDALIKAMEEKATLDSIAIVELTKRIETEGPAVTQKEREELKNLSHDQKVNWLINRYTRKSI